MDINMKIDGQDTFPTKVLLCKNSPKLIYRSINEIKRKDFFFSCLTAYAIVNKIASNKLLIGSASKGLTNHTLAKRFMSNSWS